MDTTRTGAYLLLLITFIKAMSGAYLGSLRTKRNALYHIQPVTFISHDNRHFLLMYRRISSLLNRNIQGVFLDALACLDFTLVSKRVTGS